MIKFFIPDLAVKVLCLYKKKSNLSQMTHQLRFASDKPQMFKGIPQIVSFSWISGGIVNHYQLWHAMFHGNYDKFTSEVAFYLEQSISQNGQSPTTFLNAEY